MIPILDFCNEYHGHQPSFLNTIADEIRQHNKRIVWLAGDSSLDNKFWICNRAAPVNVYETILTKGTIPMDVAYHLNKIFIDSGEEFVCINCAVEESTLASRRHRLLSHDTVIQEKIKPGDALIISVGGNDIALSPSIATIASLMAVTTLASNESIVNGVAIGMGHLLSLFNDDTQNYIQRIVSKCNGGIHIIVCMIYYPAIELSHSWADTALAALGYDRNPQRLQLLIKSAYEHGTLKIKIPNCTVTGCPLYEVLDPRNQEDYEARVEPSDTGGSKMARSFFDLIKKNNCK